VSRTWRRDLAGGCLIVLGAGLIVGSLALHAWGGSTSSDAVGTAPPLSSVELTALAHDRAAVTSLPRAFGEVPNAMVDAARSSAGTPLDRTAASEILFEHPELGPLLMAVERPSATAAPLASLLSPAAPPNGPPLLSNGLVVVVFVLPGLAALGLGLALRSRRGGRWVTRAGPITCLVAGALLTVGLLVPDDGGAAPIHALGGVAAAAPSAVTAPDVQGALATLEQVYDDVVPALQIAGAAGRVVLDPQSAVAVLGADRHLRALNGFVTNFNALYGVGVLVTQQAASRAETSVAPHAMRGLVWLGLGAALAFLVVGVTGASRRILRRDGPASGDDRGAAAFSSEVSPELAPVAAGVVS
jgi:hypothetical protein